MISIFLNTRKRVSLLKKLIDSLIEKTKDLSNIELLIRYDDDDIQTHNFLDALSLDFVRAVSGPRPNNLHIAINETVSHSVGDFLFVLNDDVSMITQDWDLELKNINSGEIWYIAVKDNSCDKVRDKKYSSFPIITRAAYEALGYFMSNRLVGLGGDVHLWRIFNETGRIKQSEIKVDHVLHRTTQEVLAPDEVAFYMRENTRMNFVDPWTIDIGEEIEKISSCI